MERPIGSEKTASRWYPRTLGLGRGRRPARSVGVTVFLRKYGRLQFGVNGTVPGVNGDDARST